MLELEAAGLKMTLRMEHAPAAPAEDGDEDGRLCTICKTNCWLSYGTTQTHHAGSAPTQLVSL